MVGILAQHAAHQGGECAAIGEGIVALRVPWASRVPLTATWRLTGRGFSGATRSRRASSQLTHTAGWPSSAWPGLLKYASGLSGDTQAWVPSGILTFISGELYLANSPL